MRVPPQEDLTAQLDRIAGPYRPRTDEADLAEKRERLVEYFGSVASSPAIVPRPGVNPEDLDCFSQLSETRGD